MFDHRERGGYCRAVHKGGEDIIVVETISRFHYSVEMGCFIQHKYRSKIFQRKQSPPAAVKSIKLCDNKPAILPEPARIVTQHANWLINNNPPRRPLPLPRETPSEKGSFIPINKQSLTTTNSKSWVTFIHSEPKPLPPPKDHYPTALPTRLQCFTYQEISTACNSFSPERCLYEGPAESVYRASLKQGSNTDEHRVENATVTRLLGTRQTYKEFLMEVNTISCLDHSHLCKLIGFHARENGERMIVYERLHHGSLDGLLYGNRSPSLTDWRTRMKMALGVAQGLTYLHEEGPFQAMYCEFNAANVQIDKEFNAKLSDYGFARCNLEAQVPYIATAPYLAPETVARGLVTPKSNVWSFGIMLLELLTGRQHMNHRRPKDERNLVKWSMKFVKDERSLAFIVDPRLIAGFSIQEAKIVADLAQRCLHKEPLDRPTMRAAVQILKRIQDMTMSNLPKYPLRKATVHEQ